VLKVRTTLSSIMSEAVQRNIITANPCHGIKGLPSAEPRKMLCLNPAEVATLAEAIDPHYRTLIYVAAYTGLRAGELHELRWRDVDLMRGRINVTRALKAWRQGTPIIGKTKTNKPRAVDLAPHITRLLSDHAALSRPGGNPGGHQDTLVFTNSVGTAIHQVAWLRNHFKPAVARALPRYALPNPQTLRFHDLRHTFVSMLIAQNVHPKAIHEQAGHASITTTMDRYGHLLPGASDTVKEALTAAFEQGQNTAPVTQLRQAG